MTGLHCSDCIYSTFIFNEKMQKYQATCSRGYTLADPRVHTDPERFFSARIDGLVPVTDPYDKEYLRTSNVCDRFQSPSNFVPPERPKKHFWES